MTDQLIARLPRRMKQPPKHVLRDQLAMAALEIERLRVENARLRQPWWQRWFTPSGRHVPTETLLPAAPTDEAAQRAAAE